jgi:hypothetical protein
LGLFAHWNSSYAADARRWLGLVDVGAVKLAGNHPLKT